MNLTPADKAMLCGFVFAALAILITFRTEQDWWRGVKRKLRRAWPNTVGAWFTRRRSVIRHRVGAPSEACRRDINTGVWT